MKVLVSCVPQTGHIFPLLHLARAFADRGDEVVLASGPNAAESIGPGLSFQAVGPSFDAWFSALRERTRGIPGDGLAPSRVEGYFLPRLFGEIGTALMLDDLLALCEELEPGLIVFDPYLFAAPLVAALTGTPAVLHTIGPLMDPSILEFVADAVSPIWRVQDGRPTRRRAVRRYDAHDLPRLSQERNRGDQKGPATASRPPANSVGLASRLVPRSFGASHLCDVGNVLEQ